MVLHSVTTTQPELQIKTLPLVELKFPKARTRKHPPSQIELLKSSILQFGFVTPVLLGSDNAVIAGHGRVAAARALGLGEIPTLDLSHLSPEQQRAYAIADNRLAEKSEWDADALAIEFKDLDAIELPFDLEITGFASAEIDGFILPPGVQLEDDQAPELRPDPVTRPGDLWRLGEHKLVCGDATDAATYTALMGGEIAAMAFADPPFNVPVERHIRRRTGGHREFAQGAGELAPEAFEAFLQAVLVLAASVCAPGAISFWCMDWRHLAQLFAAGAAAELELKNLIVWAKTNCGLGGFYRSQHEHIAVFKKPGAEHLNTFGMGKSGRHRSNLWSYAGVSSFGAERDDELAMHPTVKPTVMVADAIKDVSRRGDIVLDPFGGSGATLIAAEKTRRKARLIEIDAAYCDLICERFTAYSGRAAVLEATGETFEAVRQRRVAEAA